MSDNIDDRFREIVAAQLADLDEDPLDDLDFEEAPPAVPAPPEVVPETSSTSWPPSPETSPRSWTPAPEPDDFVPPPPLPPAPRPSSIALSGIASIAAGVVLLGGVILGWLSASWATPLGFVTLCGGILVLFTRLPKDRDAGPDNGAKI